MVVSTQNLNQINSYFKEMYNKRTYQIIIKCARVWNDFTDNSPNCLSSHPVVYFFYYEQVKFILILTSSWTQL